MDEIIKKLSQKHDIPMYALKVLIDAPFRMMSDEFEKKSLKNFNFPHLGKIVMSEGKKEWVRNNILNNTNESDTTDNTGMEKPTV